MDYKITRLTDNPEIKEKAAQWFHEKWSVPVAEYISSMNACLRQEAPVPQWYLALESGKIIGGLGVIENDFHNRKDLTPNICAVYTEKAKRGFGVAGALLNFACADMQRQGINTLCLITDHKSFYERYGWKYFCMVKEEGQSGMTRMYIHQA